MKGAGIYLSVYQKLQSLKIKKKFILLKVAVLFAVGYGLLRDSKCFGCTCDSHHQWSVTTIVVVTK